jgi:hypothetical protein
MWNPGVMRFEYQYGQYYVSTRQYTLGCPDFGFTVFRDWERRGWARYLTAISFSGSGSFNVVTHGLADDGSSYPPLGTPRVYGSGTYSVSRSLD